MKIAPFGLQILKRYLLVLLSLLITIISFAQTPKIDSLKIDLEQYPFNGEIDTTYARLEHDLAFEYSQIENFGEAIVHELQALKYIEGNSLLLFKIHNSLGRYYLELDDFVGSLTEFKLALQVAIEMNDPIKIGIVNYNLSTHYDRTSNDSLSYAHLKIAYDLMIENGDTTNTIYLLNSLATFEIENHQDEIALKRFQEALALSLSTGDSTLISNSYNNIANYYLLTLDTVTALQYLKNSYAIDKVSGTAVNTAIVTYNIATMYSITNKLDSALVYIEIAKKKALETSRISLLKPIYNMVFQLYYEAELYDSLPTVFNDFQTISDSLLTKENLKKYAEAQSEIELITTQQENALLQFNEQATHQKLIYLAIVIGLLLLIIIGSLFAIKRIKSQKEFAETLHKQTKIQNSKIEQQQEKLIKQNSELEKNALYKDRIMSLLAHDLRTPFASIHSLNHLVNASGELNTKQTEFMDTSNKVIAGGLDLISDILHIYKLEHIDDFDFELLNISMLLNNSAEKLEPITLVKNQKIKLEFDPNIEFVINREMLQSAVDNLLSNASKYSGNGKEIIIKMRLVKNQLEIKIIDQGYGFSEKEKLVIFDRFNKFTRKTLRNESSTGLGLFLVKGFIKKLGGQISLESNLNEGSTFTLLF